MAFLAASLIIVAVLSQVFLIVGLLPPSLAQAPANAPVGTSKPSFPAYADYSDVSMEPAEKRALFEVMNAMAEGGDWSQVHPDPCGLNVWHGLECDVGKNLTDANMHVISLAFGLTSGLDPNPSCKFDAYIPRAILNLTFLENLFIFDCFTRRERTIPSYLGQLTSLEMLDMRDNRKLVGRIPPELGSLTSLQVFSLALNNLSGSIPDLGDLHSLQNLDFSYNALNGSIPSSLGRLTNLQILNLRSNHLGGMIPSSLGRLSKLQKLDLGGNALEGTVPSSLGSISPLVLLGIDNNKLERGLPEAFENLISLQYLLAHNNPMHHPLPNFWGSMRDALVYASLSNSSYTGPIPDSIGELRNLSFLALDNNELTGNIPEGMEELTSITFLNLSANQLSGPVPFSTSFLKMLGSGLSLDRNSALCEPSTYTPVGLSLGLPTCPKRRDTISPELAPTPGAVPRVAAFPEAAPPTLAPEAISLVSQKSAARIGSGPGVFPTVLSVFTCLALGLGACKTLCILVTSIPASYYLVYYLETNFN